jgi:transposase
MLKIVLLAYSRGVVSSRAIERLCRENVLFMAISGDSAPQFTTIAKVGHVAVVDPGYAAADLHCICK